MNTQPRIGYLAEARMEVGTGEPGYRWRNAWRIADADGRDMVNPYFLTKTEARRVAAEIGITLAGYLEPQR